VYEGLSCGGLGDKVVYRDKEKQKVAVREATRRWRVSRKVSPKEGITESGITSLVTIENVKAVVASLPKQDWREKKVVGCRRFGEDTETA
jgi:hypothetical protein